MLQQNTDSANFCKLNDYFCNGSVAATKYWQYFWFNAMKIEIWDWFIWWILQMFLHLSCCWQQPVARRDFEPEFSVCNFQKSWEGYLLPDGHTGPERKSKMSFFFEFWAWHQCKVSFFSSILCDRGYLSSLISARGRCVYQCIRCISVSVLKTSPSILH